MDLKQYYRKMREVEASLNSQDILVVSLETPDGGKAGVISEVSKSAAAKLIVEGRAVVANESEREAYLERQAAARKAAQKAEMAKRVQVAIISESDLEKPTSKKTSDLGPGK